MKVKSLSLIIAFFLLTISVNAQENITSQDYTTSLGIKFYPGAITVKHFFTPKTAGEGLIYFWDKGTRLTGLYEIHFPIHSTAGLKWYVGPGAHLGFYNDKYGGGTSFGIDGVIGFDYKFQGAPINLSLDWQPSIEFGNYYDDDRFIGYWFGFSIRYVF